MIQTNLECETKRVLLQFDLGIKGIQIAHLSARQHSEAATRRVLKKKMFLEIPQNSQKTPVPPATLLK